MYDICVRTADGGGDARGQYSSDRLMGDLFAAPYVTLEPEHGHVLDDGAGNVVGYIVGCADTAVFVQRYRDEWIPALAGIWAEPPDPPRNREQAMLALHHHPERRLVPELAAYPAHLHIDLLPSAQGQGHGARLLASFIEALRAAGIPGVHLGVSAQNPRAIAFYRREGFETLLDAGWGLWMGRRC